MDIRTELLKHVKNEDGKLKLSCHRAHVLAEELGVALGQIGQVCQAEGIKIINCQLGCFGDGSKHG
jgi:hypothetical protein